MSVRPIPESRKHIFEDWLENKDWSWLEEKCDPSLQVEEWEKIVELKLNEICPTKMVKLSNRDKPFFTGDLKTEFRQLCRIYQKNRRSKCFLNKKIKFNRNYKKAPAHYLENNVSAAIKGNLGKAPKALKWVSVPGDCQQGGSFQLVNHFNKNLTIEESKERFVEHFAVVSQEFGALNVEKMSSDIKQSINEDSMSKPILTEFEVWEILKNMKTTKSSVPGDVPPKLRKLEEIVKPITKFSTTL